MKTFPFPVPIETFGFADFKFDPMLPGSTPSNPSTPAQASHDYAFVTDSDKVKSVPEETKESAVPIYGVLNEEISVRSEFCEGKDLDLRQGDPLRISEEPVGNLDSHGDSIPNSNLSIECEIVSKSQASMMEIESGTSISSRDVFTENSKKEVCQEADKTLQPLAELKSWGKEELTAARQIILSCQIAQLQTLATKPVTDQRKAYSSCQKCKRSKRKCDLRYSVTGRCSLCERQGIDCIPQKKPLTKKQLQAIQPKPKRVAKRKRLADHLNVHKGEKCTRTVNCGRPFKHPGHCRVDKSSK